MGGACEECAPLVKGLLWLEGQYAHTSRSPVRCVKSVITLPRRIDATILGDLNYVSFARVAVSTSYIEKHANRLPV